MSSASGVGRVAGPSTAGPATCTCASSTRRPRWRRSAPDSKPRSQDIAGALGSVDVGAVVNRSLTELVELAPPGIDELLGVLSVLEAARAATTPSSSTRRRPATRCGCSRCRRSRANGCRRCCGCCSSIESWSGRDRWPASWSTSRVRSGRCRRCWRIARRRVSSPSRARRSCRVSKPAGSSRRLRRLRIATPMLIVNALTFTDRCLPPLPATQRARAARAGAAARPVPQPPLRYHPGAARHAAAARHRIAGPVGTDLDRMKTHGHLCLLCRRGCAPARRDADARPAPAP